VEFLEVVVTSNNLNINLQEAIIAILKLKTHKAMIFSAELVVLSLNQQWMVSQSV
jgi:hypothetical protein